MPAAIVKKKEEKVTVPLIPPPPSSDRNVATKKQHTTFHPTFLFPRGWKERKEGVGERGEGGARQTTESQPSFRMAPQLDAIHPPLPPSLLIVQERCGKYIEAKEKKERKKKEVDHQLSLVACPTPPWGKERETRDLPKQAPLFFFLFLFFLFVGGRRLVTRFALSFLSALVNFLLGKGGGGGAVGQGLT